MAVQRVMGPAQAERTTLGELAGLFLRLGATAFGGPAAHIAMMKAEVVDRRRWLSEERFLDLLGATNLIPGPNSTEMAIHIGWDRRRWPGLAVAGVSFIVPAMLLTGAIGWAYVTFGTLPQAGWLLYGVKPVILGVILQAIWGLAPKAASAVKRTSGAGLQGKPSVPCTWWKCWIRPNCSRTARVVGLPLVVAVPLRPPSVARPSTTPGYTLV